MGDPLQEQLSVEIQQAFATKDWPGALIIVDLWCRLYPKHAQGWYWRSGCLMQTGHLDLALADAEHALDLNPADHKARMLRDSLVIKLNTGRPSPEVKSAPEQSYSPKPEPEPEPKSEIVNAPEPAIEDEAAPEHIAAVVTDHQPEGNAEDEFDDKPEFEVVIVQDLEPESELEPAPGAAVISMPDIATRPDASAAGDGEPKIVSFDAEERISQNLTAGAAPRVQDPNQALPERAGVPNSTSSIFKTTPAQEIGTAHRSKKIPWGALGALVFIVVAISWAVFDHIRVPDLRVNQNEASSIRKKMFASVVPPHPSVASRTTCDVLRLPEYVEVFGKFQPDPAAWEEAKYCLEVVGSEDSAVELLNLLRPGHRRWGSSSFFQKTSRRGTTSDVRSVLIRMDADISRPLVTALGDEFFDVRKVAAEALAYRRKHEDVRALVRSCMSSNIEVREVAVSVLGDLVGSGQITGSEGFELMTWMAGDQSAEVRYEVAKALTVFEGSEAEALATSMTKDPHRKVSEAARRVVGEFSKRE